MTLKLRTIYSLPDGKKAEYYKDGKVHFRLFPLSMSDKKIIDLFASGNIGPKNKADQADAKANAAAEKEEKKRQKADAKANAAAEAGEQAALKADATGKVRVGENAAEKEGENE